MLRIPCLRSETWGTRFGGRLGDEVPLVDDEDDGAARLVGVAADVGVEGGDAFGGVEDEEADVGGLEVLAGHDDRQLFGHELGLALATDSGGVDETEVVRAAGDDFVDCVTGGAGDGRDDGARAAGEGVEQRGFADVGTADDGDLGLVLDECAVGTETAERFGALPIPPIANSGDGWGTRFRGRGGKGGADGGWNCRKDRVEEVADAGAVLGGDGEDVAEAEAAEVFGGGSEGGGVDLVDGEEDGLAAAQEETGEGDVGAGELGAAVYHHNYDLRLGEGGAGLKEDFGGDEFGIVGDDAAGVDEACGGGLPLDEAVDAVAGDAGLVANDGAARAGEAIEERRLADVGTAADGDEWERAGGGGVSGEIELGGEDFGVAPGTGLGGGFGGGCWLLVAGCWLRAGGAGFGGGRLGGDGATGGLRFPRDYFAVFSFGGAGGGALLFGEIGALGGEDFALARGGLPSYRASGGSGAGGAALLWAGGCLTMLLAEAFSVVALRHGECLPETRCA